MHATGTDDTSSEEPQGSEGDQRPAPGPAHVREAERLAPDLGVPVAALREHLELLPAAYAASVRARSLIRHARMAGDPPAVGEVHTRVTPGRQDPAADTLDVIALDQAGLFAKVAGVLALHGGHVLEASAFTREDGLAVTTFTIRRPVEQTGSFWARVEGDIVEAMAGRLAVRARVARRVAADAAGRSDDEQIPTAVTVKEEPGGDTSLVEVHTADHPGALYAISAALGELELDIVSATIRTVGAEVADLFHVRNTAGEPLDEDHAAEVELAVTCALDGPPGP